MTALAQLSESHPGLPLRSKTPPRTAVKGMMRKKLSFMLTRGLLWIWTLKVSASGLEDDDEIKRVDHDFPGRISRSLSNFTTIQ